MRTIENHIAALTDSLESLIASAPDGDGQGGIATPSGPKYVRESWGWGAKYCEPIELRGDEWLAAFELVNPVVATGGIVTMVGDRGPGKTQMAAELARGGGWPSDKQEYSRGDGLVIHRGKTALYRRAMDIFLELREAMKNHVKTSEREVLAKLSNVGLLVIDEFQERGETSFENQKMNNIIDKRYASERPTIIIANLTRKELNDALGASIVDRAKENGKSIEFSWPSFRGKKNISNL
jgi:hypothetical protein